LKGLVNVAAVDADQFKSLGGRFGIQGFPTIKLFNVEKQKPEDYQGERNSVAMLEYVARLSLSSHHSHLCATADTARKPSRSFWSRVLVVKPKQAMVLLLPLRTHLQRGRLSNKLVENPVLVFLWRLQLQILKAKSFKARESGLLRLFICPFSFLFLAVRFV
jgi:hypothetical protein